MPDDAHDLLAEPGDDDLDIDVHCLVLTAVIVEGRELLIRGAGGHGRWIDVDGTDGPVDVITDLSFHVELVHAPEDVFDHFVARLYRWRDEAVPLRLCGAPGRMTTLSENRNVWIPLPRRKHPRWVDG